MLQLENNAGAAESSVLRCAQIYAEAFGERRMRFAKQVRMLRTCVIVGRRKVLRKAFRGERFDTLICKGTEVRTRALFLKLRVCAKRFVNAQKSETVSSTKFRSGLTQAHPQPKVTQ